VSYAAIARAPIEEIEAYASARDPQAVHQRRAWRGPDRRTAGVLPHLADRATNFNKEVINTVKSFGQSACYLAMSSLPGRMYIIVWARG
jgi:hypothetical protein